MMYEMFVNELMEQLERIVENTDVVLERTTVQKVNGELDGIAVKHTDSMVAPIFCLKDVYEDYKNGVPVIRIAQSLAHKLDELRGNTPNVPQLSRESAMDNLYCAVIGVKDNEELLQTIPHKIIEDLAIVPRFRVGDAGSFLVYNGMCSHLKMMPDEIMEVAQRNTEREQYVCVSMSECISELMFGEEGVLCGEPSPMYVLTNQSKVNGAVAITSQMALRNAYKMIGGDYYILPSSRHELILVRKEEMHDVDVLKNMVREVNSTVLEKEDKLSDNVYYYNGVSQRVCMV